jgi:hypothetical protein
MNTVPIRIRDKSAQQGYDVMVKNTVPVRIWKAVAYFKIL